MKRIALLMVLLIGLAATSAARSQQPTPSKSNSQDADSVLLKPSPELQKSLDDLAAAVQALMHRIASDPQIKAAAVQVATGAVTTAQQVVAEQSVNIANALKKAADQISASQAIPPEHAKKP
jgi:hypothetical protein